MTYYRSYRPNRAARKFGGMREFMADRTEKAKKYKLDLSAGFYPYVSGRKSQSLFCVGAELTCVVDKPLFAEAVNAVMQRFPLYKTKLKKGYGGYYLKENSAPVPVFGWNGKPQTPIDPEETNGYRFRFSLDGNRIYLEMFHALTDANGAMRFLLAAVRRYRELSGITFDVNCNIPAFDEPVPSAETEDSFLANYRHIKLSELNLKGMAGGVPHRISGTPLKGALEADERTASADSLIAKAKQAGVTLSAYIAGTAACSIAGGSSLKHSIQIMVPVNLRRMFPSETSHNFITFVRLSLSADKCATLETCVKECAKQLSEKVTRKSMSAFISTTVRAQRNLLFRAVPLCVKWLLIRFGRLFLKSRQTIIVSNLGNISVPPELGVKRLSLMLNTSDNNVTNLGVASCGGVCTLAFTRKIKENDLSERFFYMLGI